MVRSVRFQAVVLLLTGFCPAGPLPAQQVAPVQRASQLLGGGDPAGAVQVLGPYLAEHPDDGRGWLVLARAHIAREAWDEAVAASDRAASDGSLGDQARVEGALARAGRGQLTEAFEMLLEVKTHNTVDLTALAAQPRAARITGHERYAELLPSVEEYEHPFAEDVRILREWRAEAPGGAFGWIARNIGDVDGDGIADFVTSAPNLESNRGRVYVYSSGSGERLWSADGSAAGDRLGVGIEAAGDVNADGIPDVVAGAPGAGRAFVYSGRDGAPLLTLSGAVDMAFGQHVSDAGDVNGDGHADVVVSAPGSPSNPSPGPGSVWVYSGSDGSALVELEGAEDGDGFGSAVAGATTSDGSSLLVVGAGTAGERGVGRVLVYRDLGREPAFTIEPDETGAWLGGMFVSVPGDVDGDGVPDVYASDWTNSAKGPQTGRVYVHSGADGHRLMALTGDLAGEGFGTSVSDAGDLDGDGHADLAVGAWQHASLAPGGGRISVVSGRTGTRVWTITGKVPGETLGFDSTGIGDVDGDGVGDLLITSAWSSIRGPRSGRVYIVAGKPWS